MCCTQHMQYQDEVNDVSLVREFVKASMNIRNIVIRWGKYCV